MSLEITRESVTAPHFLAYTFVIDQLMKRVKYGAEVLDFGARQSALPLAMAELGFTVSITDRDTSSREFQRQRFAPGGRSLEWLDSLPLDASCDVVTACWVLQHNELDEIRRLTSHVWHSLKPGGMFLYVGSWSPTRTFWQGNRKDPQWVLGDYDLRSSVILQFTGDDESRGKLVDQKWFWYEHATLNGDYCESTKANAVALALVKAGD